MDRQHIREAQVIERYLKGTLSAAEEQAFEEAYLADPELLEELEVAERLRAGLRDLNPAASTVAAAPRRARWLDLAASPRYGIAASFVAVVALMSTTTLYVQNQGLRGNGGFQAAAPTRVLPLVSVRGPSTPNEIAAPARGELTVLMIEPGFGDYDAYRAVVMRAGTEILRLDGLTPSYEEMLALSIPSDVLSPGEYEILLSGGRRDWPAAQALDELSRTPLKVAARP